MLVEGKIVVRQVGETSVDDARSHIRLGHRRPTAARRALEIGVLENLDRGIDFAYQVALRGTGVGRVGDVANFSSARLGLAGHVTECSHANQCNQTEYPEKGLWPI